MKEPSHATRTRVLGYVLLFMGFALFLPGLMVLAALLSSVVQSGPEGVLGDSTVAGLALAAMAFGVVIFRTGATLRNNARKMCVIDGWTLLKGDPRPPILYLRSFLDDEKTSIQRTAENQGGALGSVVAKLLGGAAGAHQTQEEQLLKGFTGLGPCIAVGDPAETLPDLGAARIYLSDDWQSHVAALMARSRLVVFRVGSHSPGFWWEVDRVRRLVSAERVAFWIPPQAEGGQDSGLTYEEFAAKLGENMPGELPKWREGAQLLRFGPDWNTAHLSPSFDLDSKGEWPRRPWELSARLFRRVVLPVIGVLLAVQIYTGRLTPRDLLTSVLLGPSVPARTTVPPPGQSVRSAAFLAQLVREINKSLPKLVDTETEFMSASSRGRATRSRRNRSWINGTPVFLRIPL